MSEEFNGSIGMSEDLAMSVIKDQAGSLVDGWREAIQNGLDAPGATKVTLDVAEDKSQSVIEDNGDGMDLTDEEAREFLDTLGKSTKEAGDDSTIGRFGMGFGQVLAKGQVTVQTGNTMVEFDVQEWGLKYKLREMDSRVDGFRATINHYEGEVPSFDSHEWENYLDDIRKRFRRISVATDQEVMINGSQVGSDHLGMAINEDKGIVREVDLEAGGGFTAHIALEHNVGSVVDVYSNGLYVKTESLSGFKGEVVTKGNLDLNFARNDIKSGDPRWNAVKDKLEEFRKEILRGMSDQNLNSRSREAVALFAANDEGGEFGDYTVFRQANGQMLSYNEVIEASEVAYATGSEEGVDELIERGNIILDEQDGAVRNIRRHNTEDLPTAFSVSARAEEQNIVETHDRIDPNPSKLEMGQMTKLWAAKLMADRLGIDREIVFGESNTAHAWTDGSRYIALTGSVWSSGRHMIWLKEVYDTLIHEWAHDTDSTDTMSHGQRYSLDYRKKMENSQDDLTKMLEEVDEKGIADLLRDEGYHPEQHYPDHYYYRD